MPWKGCCWFGTWLQRTALSSGRQISVICVLQGLQLVHQMPASAVLHNLIFAALLPARQQYDPRDLTAETKPGGLSP